MSNLIRIPPRGKGYLWAMRNTYRDKFDVLKYVYGFQDATPSVDIPDAWGYWTMDELYGIRADATGNGYHAYPGYGIDQNSPSGKVNNCVHFSNMNGSLSISGRPDFSTTDQPWTIAFWFKLHWTGTPAAGDEILPFAFNWYPACYMWADSTGRIQMIDAYTDHLYISKSYAVGQGITPEEWHFFCMRYDTVGLFLEIDGESLGSDIGSDYPAYVNYANPTIGYEYGEGEITNLGSLEMDIDEFGIWMCSLDADQRARLYNDGAGYGLYSIGTQPDYGSGALWAHWEFDEATPPDPPQNRYDTVDNLWMHPWYWSTFDNGTTFYSSASTTGLSSYPDNNSTFHFQIGYCHGDDKVFHNVLTDALYFTSSGTYNLTAAEVAALNASSSRDWLDNASKHRFGFVGQPDGKASLTIWDPYMVGGQNIRWYTAVRLRTVITNQGGWYSCSAYLEYRAHTRTWYTLPKNTTGVSGNAALFERWTVGSAQLEKYAVYVLDKVNNVDHSTDFNALINNNPFSMAYWFKCPAGGDSAGTNPQMRLSIQTGAPSYAAFWMYVTVYRLNTSSSLIGYDAYFYWPNGYIEIFSYDPSYVYSRDDWHLAVVTWDGHAVQVYIDDMYRACGGWTGGAISGVNFNTNTAQIELSQNSGAVAWHVDDVRIYDGPLTLEQRLALYGG